MRTLRHAAADGPARATFFLSRLSHGNPNDSLCEPHLLHFKAGAPPFFLSLAFLFKQWPVTMNFGNVEKENDEHSITVSLHVDHGQFGPIRKIVNQSISSVLIFVALLGSWSL